MEDRRNVGESSCKSGDGTDQRVQSLMFMITRERDMAKGYSYELYEIFNEPNIVNCINVKRLSWAGHLVRMNSDR